MKGKRSVFQSFVCQNRRKNLQIAILLAFLINDRIFAQGSVFGIGASYYVRDKGAPAATTEQAIRLNQVIAH
jgi:hypothetical protein